MKTRFSCVAGAVAALLAGCSSPHLAVGPESTSNVPAGGSMGYQALAQDSNGTIQWSLNGPGVLTPTVGSSVFYYAPATFPTSGPLTAKITVSLSDAPDETKVINITIVKPSSSVGGIAGLTTETDVSYDTRGIPTITCTPTTDCYAVLGYIHARDRLFEMDFLRRAARGTLSELIGSLGLDQDISSRTVFTAPVPGSSPAQAAPVAEQLAPYLTADPFVGPRFVAYVAGINKRIAEIRADPSLLPEDYSRLLFAIDPAKTTDLPDWSVEDTVAVFRLQQFQLSANISGKLDSGRWAAAFFGRPDDTTALRIRAWIRAKMADPSYTLAGSGAPNAPSVVAVPSPGSLSHLQGMGPVLDQAKARVQPLERLIRSMGEPAGSNNWVIDAAHSATGQAMVANDPHLTLQYPALFHLSHLVGTADQLNIIGGAFPGVPVTLIGRGAHVGWGVTVVGYDVTEVYQETLGPPGPGGLPTVMYNGQPVVCAISQQTVGVRTSAGIGTQTLNVFVVPHHGPLVALDAAHGVAFSVRWTGHNPATDDARAFYRLNTAASVADAMQALDGDPKPDGGTYTGYYTGAQNFVLADDTGNIGYDPHACVPSRLWATSLAVYPLPNVPVPGTGTQHLEWGDNLGQPLCVPNDKLPRAAGSTKGFLATANSDPLGVSDDNDPYSGNPGGVPYLSYAWDDGLGFRIARIQDVLSATIADAGTVSLDDVHALQTDHTMYLAQPFLAAITAADAIHSTNPNVAAGATLLASWSLDCPTGLGGTTPGTSPSSLAVLDPVRAPNDADPGRSRDSAACMLFHTFLRKVLAATFSDEAAIAGVGVDSQSAIRGLAYLLSAEGQASNPTNLLCSDVALNGTQIVTVTNKTCSTQVLDALGFAYARLKNVYGAESNWRWGRVHTVTFTHPLYPLVDEGFNPGPFVRPGGASTVDVANPSAGDPNNLSFAYTAAGNVRWAAVLDGTVPNTTFQLPGLESGAAFDPNAPGMLGDYLTNTYFQWPFKPTEVTAVATQTFTP